MRASRSHYVMALTRSKPSRDKCCKAAVDRAKA
jgi:hypothetical protein